MTQWVTGECARLRRDRRTGTAWGAALVAQERAGQERSPGLGGRDRRGAWCRRPPVGVRVREGSTEPEPRRVGWRRLKSGRWSVRAARAWGRAAVAEPEPRTGRLAAGRRWADAGALTSAQAPHQPGDWCDLAPDRARGLLSLGRPVYEAAAVAREAHEAVAPAWRVRATHGRRARASLLSRAAREADAAEAAVIAAWAEARAAQSEAGGDVSAYDSAVDRAIASGEESDWLNVMEIMSRDAEAALVLG